jgi:hypothetical protein
MDMTDKQDKEFRCSYWIDITRKGRKELGISAKRKGGRMTVGQLSFSCS